MIYIKTLGTAVSVRNLGKLQFKLLDGRKAPFVGPEFADFENSN